MHRSGPGRGTQLISCTSSCESRVVILARKESCLVLCTNERRSHASSWQVSDPARWPSLDLGAQHTVGGRQQLTREHWLNLVDRYS